MGQGRHIIYVCIYLPYVLCALAGHPFHSFLFRLPAMAVFALLQFQGLVVRWQ